MVDYVYVATFAAAGEVPMGAPVQTFRHAITASPTLATVFTVPPDVPANSTIRVELTATVDSEYAIAVSPTADITLADNGTRFASAGVTFYLWALVGERISIRSAQA